MKQSPQLVPRCMACLTIAPGCLWSRAKLMLGHNRVHALQEMHHMVYKVHLHLSLVYLTICAFMIELSLIFSLVLLSVLSSSVIKKSSFSSGSFRSSGMIRGSHQKGSKDKRALQYRSQAHRNNHDGSQVSHRSSTMSTPSMSILCQNCVTMHLGKC